MSYKINKVWNERHLRRYKKEWRSEWEDTFAWWLKGTYPPKTWHIKKHYGKWLLLRGHFIIAKQPPATNRNYYHFDFRMFLRYCKSLQKLLRTRSRKLIEGKSFEDQMQFFTAYHYSKKDERDPHEIYLENESAAFNRLMRDADSSDKPGWRTIIEESDRKEERDRLLERIVRDEELFSEDS